MFENLPDLKLETLREAKKMTHMLNKIKHFFYADKLPGLFSLLTMQSMIKIEEAVDIRPIKIKCKSINILLIV
jgi:hypothetical protein